MVKGKVNLALVLIVTLGLSACASKEQKTIVSDVPAGTLDISGIYEIEKFCLRYTNFTKDHRKA